MGKKKKTGNRKTALTLSVISLVTIFAFALTSYSGVLDATFTGAFLADGVNDSISSTPFTTVEASTPIEIWADTYVELEHDEDALVARLKIDTGEPLAKQTIDVDVDSEPYASAETDSDGEVVILFEADNASRSVSASFSGSDMEYLNPSETLITLSPATVEEELSITANVTYDDYITYTAETEAIHIVNDGAHCTEEDPCRFNDIYEADQKNGWGCMMKLYDYYKFDCALHIGDGSNETWLFSKHEQLWINKPFLIDNKAFLKFGEIIDDRLSIGAFVFANVSEEDELQDHSAIKIKPGGGLYFYLSKYTVMTDEAENNIYASVGSELVMNDFTLQRKDKTKETAVYTPPGAVIAEDNFVSGGRYVPLVSKEEPLFTTRYNAIECVSSGDLGGCE